MNTRLKRLAAIATSPLAFIASSALAQSATTAPTTSTSTSGTSRIPLPTGVQNIPTRGTLEGSAVTIINFALGFVGLVAVGFLIYGGFLYIASRGEPQETTKAKNVLIYAIAGLIVVILSFLIVQAVVNIL